MMDEMVTVIIPCYNSEEVIARSLESALGQTYSNIEVWVIDDGSLDGTLDILKGYKDPRLHFYTIFRNTGSPVKPRNIGISKAAGKYIAFLDSDDFWEPNKLEIQLKYMRKNKSLFSCTSYMVKGCSGINHLRTVPNRSDFNDLMILNTIGCSSVVVDKNLVSKYMFSDIRLEDYDLWLRILQDGHSILGVNECLMTYVQTKDSRSKFDIKQARAYLDMFRRFGGFNLFFSLVHCSRYLIRRLIWARL